MPEFNFISLCIAALLAINGAHASLAPGNWVKISCLQHWIPVDSDLAKHRIRLLGLAALLVGTMLVTVLR